LAGERVGAMESDVSWDNSFKVSGALWTPISNVVPTSDCT